MKRLLASASLALGLITASLAHAEAPVAPSPTPTTRILAIGTIVPGSGPAQVKATLPAEVRDTIKLYLDGKIDQWYSLEGARPGVAFILNMSDLNAAHQMLEQPPLGQAHLMKFELTPLGPLNPLRVLTEAPPPSLPFH